MNWQQVSLGQVTPQPWRNGGGRTRELLAWPWAAEWRVRLSVADVEAAGPFSRFDDIERWFAVLEGDGVVLQVAGEAHRLTSRDDPFRFDGGAQVDCTLLGAPTRDFNLMASPGAARMRRVRGEATVQSEGRALLAFYAHGSPARLESAGGLLQLPAMHVAWCVQDAQAAVRIACGNGLWMEART